MKTAAGTNLGLCLGCGDDAQRSQDEIRIIKEMLATEIDSFAHENRVDSRAARELLQEPVYVQLMVLDRGALKNCNNPSGAFVARIRDAKKQPAPTPAAPPPASLLGLMNGSVVNGTNSLPPPPPPMIAGPPLSETEKFIIENRLDHGAAHALRVEPIEVQNKLIAMGPIGIHPNPSATFMSRLRMVQSALAQSGGTPQNGGMPALEDLLDQAGKETRESNVPALEDAVGTMLKRKNGSDDGAESDTKKCKNDAGDNLLNGEALKAIQMINSRGS